MGTLCSAALAVAAWGQIIATFIEITVGNVGLDPGLGSPILCLASHCLRVVSRAPLHKAGFLRAWPGSASAHSRCRDAEPVTDHLAQDFLARANVPDKLAKDLADPYCQPASVYYR